MRKLPVTVKMINAWCAGANNAVDELGIAETAIHLLRPAGLTLAAMAGQNLI
jgi:hypothetical protein